MMLSGFRAKSINHPDHESAVASFFVKLKFCYP